MLCFRAAGITGMTSNFFTYCNLFTTWSTIGGARRDRTADLLRAKQALSQLSYGPCIVAFVLIKAGICVVC